jgi:hypothetical protein
MAVAQPSQIKHLPYEHLKKKMGIFVWMICEYPLETIM